MTPLAVSLVEEDCETPTNYLNIIYNLPAGEKAKFAVCVKGMDFPLDDLSVRMVEWLEVLKALGADKIFPQSAQVYLGFSTSSSLFLLRPSAIGSLLLVLLVLLLLAQLLLLMFDESLL